MTENVLIAVIAALSGAIPAVMATWAVLHQDARKRKQEARQQGHEAAQRITEDFVTARQVELDAMADRRQSLDERERWLNTEFQRHLAESRQRLDEIEARADQQGIELRKLDQEKAELMAEIDRMSNLLTQLKLENDRLREQNRRIPQLEARIAELERKEARSHGGDG